MRKPPRARASSHGITLFPLGLFWSFRCPAVAGALAFGRKCDKAKEVGPDGDTRTELPGVVRDSPTIVVSVCSLLEAYRAFSNVRY